jgi:hypothetical protein
MPTLTRGGRGSAQQIERVKETPVVGERARAGPKAALDVWAQIGLLSKLKLRKCAPIPVCPGDRYFVCAVRCRYQLKMRRFGQLALIYIDPG